MAANVNRGVGHQRRKRTIAGVRIDEQEYPDGSVTVFVNDEVYDGSFDEAVAEQERRGST